MTKSNNSTTEPRDPLSELPNKLIFHIFWSLPMTDVVRTTVLSKCWKNLWTTADCLRFEDCMMDSTDRVRTFIYRALMFWKGSRIVKFMIDFDSHLHRSLYSDIDLWVRFATDHQVEELHVDLQYADEYFIRNNVGAVQWSKEVMYWAPQCLYSCSSLKRLTLRGCSNLQIHGNVQWNQLEVLTVDCYGLTEHWVNQVLSGSPQLEIFIFYVTESYDNLSIQSSSLEVLFIEKSLCNRNDIPSMESELRIWTPKLESLEISGVPYSKCLLMNVSSLTEAILVFNGPNYYHHDLFRLGNDFLGETLRQILPTIQHVEKLILSDWCIKALGAMIKKKSMLQPLPNVKLLELNIDCFEEYEHFVCVLDIFPKLEMLVLDQPENEDFAPNQTLANNAKSCQTLERSFPKSFLLQLRIVKVTWTNGDDSIFPFIEIVLKYASNLKKMVFRAEGTAPPNSLLSASKRLLGMPRTSPTAELIFSEYN